MPINLELKAINNSPRRTEEIVKRIANFTGTLLQTDTYFNSKDGRLKLRQFSNGNSELIYYNRNERKGDRWSEYQVVRIQQGKRIKAFFEKTFGISVVVRKRRRLFIYKNARIHLDQVKDLGNFIEFEVLVKRGRMQAKKLYRELVELFGIKKISILKCSYSDLMMGKMKSSHNSRR